MARFLRRAAQLVREEEEQEPTSPEPVEPLSLERLSQIRCHHWRQVGLRVLAMLRYASLQRSVSACLQMDPEEFERTSTGTQPQGEKLSPSKSHRVLGYAPATCDHPMTFESMRTRIGGAAGGRHYQTCLKCGSRWTLLEEEREQVIKAKPVPKAIPRPPLTTTTSSATSSTAPSTLPSTRAPAEATERRPDGSSAEVVAALGSMSRTIEMVLTRLDRHGLLDEADDEDAVMVVDPGPTKRRARSSHA